MPQIVRIFFYDKTFEGLLSAVFDAYTLKIFPDALLATGEIAPLTMLESHHVETRADKAERVFKALEKKLSSFAFSGLLYAALADDSPSASLLFRYIRKIFDSPRSIENNLADPDVLAVSKLIRRIGAERHKIMGFARFQKTTHGAYFAVVEPAYAVLPLLAGHFKDRFGREQWMLYDAARGYGIFCNGEEFQEAYMDPADLRRGSLKEELLDADERLFQKLWKHYFDVTAISGRANPKLQARCLPRRFWKYLPEKNPRF